WTALANTLKARFYLHTAERDPTAYQKAFTAASVGIADATGASDYLAFHSDAQTETNLWHQFSLSWPQYLSAGKFLVDLLNTPPLPDPRLARSYAPNSTGQFVGAH